MSKGYEKFFKDAKRSAPKISVADQALRVALQMRKKAKNKKALGVPVAITIFLVAALGLVGAGIIYVDDIVNFVSRIEVKAISKALAEEKTAEPKDGDKEKAAAAHAGAEAAKCEPNNSWTEEELSHLKKLSERKKELDLREAELNALEEELHKQKQEIENRVQGLGKVRREIASVLKDRVDLDEERIKTLVDFYSDMKPKQAAEVFGNLNENLAVEILGRMKKKNAASILNLLSPDKARVLSEKFTGYKKR
jgi:flagellar motility protein MotE (MotC chaperone)